MEAVITLSLKKPRQESTYMEGWSVISDSLTTFASSQEADENYRILGQIGPLQ